MELSTTISVVTSRKSKVTRSFLMDSQAKKILPIFGELHFNCLLNYSTARCRLYHVKKLDALSNNWRQIVGENVKKLIAFSSRTFIAN